MSAVATKAKTKTPSARSLSLEHFVFYRAYLEGPVAIDLPFLADRYLNCGTDPRKVRALLRWFQGELAAAFRTTLDEYDGLLRRTPTYVFAAARLRLQKLYTGDRVLMLAAVLAAECDALPRDEERR